MKKLFAIALALMLCISVLSVAAFAAETITVRVKIDAESTPNAWAWGDYGNAFTAWPGEPMTQNGEYWEISVPTGTTGFIVNYGEGKAQTANINIPGDADVTINVSSDLQTVEVVGAPEDPQPQPQPTPAGDYYVAGVGALCGAEWDAGNADNKMTKGDDGIYTKTYSNVAAGKYSLKVTNGTWDQSWGGNGENGNFDFEVLETAEVIVKFNPETQQVSVVVNGDEIAPTGDVSLAAVSVALLAATAGLVVVVSKKKEIA
ncbi:MAG: starch-binding protein [Ruminococcaceae bacterium]|nr:starch-binding protein [Oscillospiraceae bacterium]